MASRGHRRYYCVAGNHFLASESEFSKAYPIMEHFAPDDTTWVLTGTCKAGVAKAAAAPPPQPTEPKGGRTR